MTGGSARVRIVFFLMVDKWDIPGRKGKFLGALTNYGVREASHSSVNGNSNGCYDDAKRAGMLRRDDWLL